MKKILLLLKKNTKIILVIVLALLFTAVFVLDIKRADPNPTIANTYPKNGSKEVPLKTDFMVKFDKPLSKERMDKLSFVIDPPVMAVRSWESSNELKLLTQEKLLPSTDYKITVLLNDKQLYSFKFKSRVFKDYSDAEIEKINQDAEVTANAFYDLVDKYPFAPDMPLKSDAYYIVYDYELEQFRIRLQLKEDSSGALKEEYLNEAIDALKPYMSNVKDTDYYVLYLDN